MPAKTFATFECLECEHEFPERMPPLYEDLPECPLCAGSTKLMDVLEAAAR